jgi:hypothetical protein
MEAVTGTGEKNLMSDYRGIMENLGVTSIASICHLTSHNLRNFQNCEPAEPHSNALVTLEIEVVS